KIVVVGYSGTWLNPIDIVLARYEGNGHLDGSFGKGGRVTTDLGGPDQANGLALQGDGRIIVAGSTVALLRYNGDGTLDTDFDGDGLVTTDFGAVAVALQADGKIIVVGSSSELQSQGDFALARYQGRSARGVAIHQMIPIIGDVQGRIAAGSRPNGRATGRISHVQAGIQQTDGGHTTPAINQLEAFITQVNDFVGQGILSPTQAQPLIDKANAVIALLRGDVVSDAYFAAWAEWDAVAVAWRWAQA